MPKVRSGESRKAYTSRAIPYMIEKEGLSPDHASGKAHGMYDQYLKKKRKRKGKK